jgi:GT2 family glycosyltransferase
MSRLLSVIIPSGRADRVYLTVEGLNNQTLDRSQYEIIIVTPKPESMQRLKDAGARIIGVDRLYAPGKMRNIGAHAACGKILFFIDDDCIPPQNWLEKSLKTLEGEKNIGAVGCRVVAFKDSFWTRCADYSLFSAYQYNQCRYGDLGSAAIGTRREAFEDAKGFDEELLASEDWDFSLKLKEKNWKCVFDPSVEVKHDHRCNTLAIIIGKAYRFGRNSGLVVQARHNKNISWLARLSVMLGNPLLYLLLIFPYGLAVTLLQLWDFRGTDHRLVPFAPIMLSSRIAYQIGVWARVWKKQHS